MRTFFNTVVCTAVGLSLLAGCNGVAWERGLFGPRRDRQLFSVDFQPGRVLRYKFVSKREILIDFGALSGKRRAGQQKHKSLEQMELVMAYRPVEIDPLGFATIEATCESAKVRRVSMLGKQASKKDAVTTAAGKSFRLKITPSGTIEDKSQLRELIKETAKAAFGRGGRKGIKEPDMIFDFIATQWFLWDSISSIKRPAEGVAVGESWQSKLLVPLPVPMRVGRDVLYQLEEVKDSETGQIAVIKSSFTLAERPDSGWPVPYVGNFQMAGTFGFFSGYEVLSLSGGGEQLYNIDAGVIESDRQEYEVRMSVRMPGMGRKSAIAKLEPNMTVRQEITMQLLGN